MRLECHAAMNAVARVPVRCLCTMTANTDAPAPTFARTVSQKLDAEGKQLPIWYWRLQIGGVTIAFGERRSEEQANFAAQAAEQNYGSDLKEGQLNQP